MTELERLLYEACAANGTEKQLAWWAKWSNREPEVTNQMALTILTMEEAIRQAEIRGGKRD